MKFKHLATGVELSNDNINPDIFFHEYKDGAELYNMSVSRAYIESNPDYFKLLEEKFYTESDMISFARYAHAYTSMYIKDNNNVKKLLKDWLAEQNND